MGKSGEAEGRRNEADQRAENSSSESQNLVGEVKAQYDCERGLLAD